jgi:hypothetical protein
LSQVLAGKSFEAGLPILAVSREALLGQALSGSGTSGKTPLRSHSSSLVQYSVHFHPVVESSEKSQRFSG